MPVAPTRFEQALLDMYGLEPNDCEDIPPDVTESDDPGVIRDALAEWGEGLGLVRLDLRRRRYRRRWGGA
jgi:hypothetical protein